MSIEGPGWIVVMKPDASPDDVLALSTLWHRLGLTIRPTSERLDVDRLHAALARALPASFGTGHVADERREVEAIAREYAKEKA